MNVVPKSPSASAVPPSMSISKNAASCSASLTEASAPSPVQSPVASAVKRQSTRVADSSRRSSALSCAAALALAAKSAIPSTADAIDAPALVGNVLVRFLGIGTRRFSRLREYLPCRERILQAHEDAHDRAKPKAARN